VSEIYDSTQDTKDHIEKVQACLLQIRLEVHARGVEHDRSKFLPPEKELFDAVTPKLKALTYGSDEYKAALVEMGAALAHHYQANDHHPDHFENGIDGMSLLALVEMLADWVAATQRVAGGNVLKSLEINRERFKISDQLYSILLNTVREMRWD
jgi:hypothetical protein